MSECGSDYYERCATLERNLARSAGTSIAVAHLRRAKQSQIMADANALIETHWRTDELARVETTLAAGSSTARLAVRLGRTEEAILDKAREIGLLKASTR